MNEERTGKCLRQVEHIRGHLWHRYSITVNQVMVATVKLSKWWLQLNRPSLWRWIYLVFSSEAHGFTSGVCCGRIVLLCVFTFVLSSVLWCPLRFRIKTIFGSSLPLVVLRRLFARFIPFNIEAMQNRLIKRLK
jgi:hypothetical protein